MEEPFNYEQMAKTFDVVLPLFEPVTNPVIAHASPRDGETVLDFACGTGEPGLTLATRHPGVELLGVDAAEAMVDIARGKAATAGLTNARFEAMRSPDLAVADESVDVVVSRFGALSFADPVGDAGELARILRRDGRVSIATWDGACKNPVSYAMTEAVRAWIPEEMQAAIRWVDEYAMPGRRESWLAKAGFSDVRSEPFSWTFEYPDESSMWDFASGPAGFGAVLSGLDDDLLTKARSEFDRLVADYRRPDGSYLVRITCRLFQARR